MRFLSTFSTALLSLTSLASAAQFTVSIPASPPLLTNPATLPPTTHATLLGASGVSHDARLSRSNTLVFKSIAPGSYLLDIHTRDYFFAPYRVDVTSEQAGADGVAATEEKVEVWQTFRGNEWDNKGAKLGEGKGDVVVSLAPNGKKDYYQKREGCEYSVGFI